MDKGLFRSVPSNVSGAPDMARIMAAAADVAGAMAYLHANNVLHGDLTGGDCPAALRLTAPARGMLQKRGLPSYRAWQSVRRTLWPVRGCSGQAVVTVME